MKKIFKFSLNESRPVTGSDICEKTIENAKYLLELSADSLLRNFRKQAGLDVLNAQPLEGWEAPDFRFRGHFVGHYLSALAKTYLTIREIDKNLAELIKKRSDYMVNELELCQQANKQGYLAAVPETQFDDLEALVFHDHNVPYYNVHKSICGLVDTYVYLKNEKALNIVCEMASYLLNRMRRLTEKRRLDMINTRWYQGNNNYVFHMEFGGMHDAVLRLYAITKNRQHLELAQMFDRPWFLEMLASNDDRLGYYSMHANTEIPCVTGMATYYNLFDDENYKQGVINFMNWMRNSHQLPTGSVSGRSAYPPPADYGGELFEYPNMLYKHTLRFSGESCCAHNLNDISHKLFEMTGDVIWCEEYENRFFNAVLAQQGEQASYTYNLSVCQGAKKNQSRDKFFCCNGSGIEYYSALVEDFYFYNENELWITQYSPSTLYWEEKGLRITQHTDFPYATDVKISLNLERTKSFSINLRIPNWSACTQININGSAVRGDVLPSTFLCLQREWQDGDVIEVKFDFALRYTTMPDRPNHVAVYYGPLLLASCAKANSTFDGTAEQLINSLKLADKPCRFFCELSCGNALFMPIKDVLYEEYNIYTIITSPKEKNIIDAVNIGTAADERAHDLKGEKIIRSNNAIEAEFGGFIECTFSGITEKQMYLKCYYAPEWERRWFDVLIESDGVWQTIATQTLIEDAKDNLEYVYYPLPQKYTTGKKKIKVRFVTKMYEGNKSNTGKLTDRLELLSD